MSQNTHCTEAQLPLEEEHTQSFNDEAAEFSAMVIEVLGSCPNHGDAKLVHLASAISNGCST